MSAFMIHKQTYANVLKTLEARRRCNIKAKYFGYCDLREDGEVEKFIKYCMEENIASVNCRYPNQKNKEDMGQADLRELIEEHDRTGSFASLYEIGKQTTDGQLLMSPECINYQSCEHRFEGTEQDNQLHQVVTSIRKMLVDERPDYQEAKWE